MQTLGCSELKQNVKHINPYELIKKAVFYTYIVPESRKKEREKMRFENKVVIVCLALWLLLVMGVILTHIVKG